MSVSILLTIHNQENILKNILSNIFRVASNNVTQYVFVLDGCTDNSETILKEELVNVCTDYVIKYTNNVFEIKANNCGLQEVTGDYVIIVQDDMLITEDNFDVRLVYPMKKYDDIWAVTARTALNFDPVAKDYPDAAEGPVGHNYKKFSYPRNKLEIRSALNRGPLAISMSKFKEVGGLFDITLPGIQGFDDIELCYRVLSSKPWKCGSFWIEYNSPLHWGKSRQNNTVIQFIGGEQDKNMNYVINKYGVETINKWRIVETRTIEETEYAL